MRSASDYTRRRFIGVTNRGLRAMNCKVVVLKGPWWREMGGHLAFLFPWAGHLFEGGPGEYIDFRVMEQGAAAPVNCTLYVFPFSLYSIMVRLTAALGEETRECTRPVKIDLKLVNIHSIVF